VCKCHPTSSDGCSLTPSDPLWAPHDCSQWSASPPTLEIFQNGTRTTPRTPLGNVVRKAEGRVATPTCAPLRAPLFEVVEKWLLNRCLDAFHKPGRRSLSLKADKLEAGG